MTFKQLKKKNLKQQMKSRKLNDLRLADVTTAAFDLIYKTLLPTPVSIVDDELCICKTCWKKRNNTPPQANWDDVAPSTDSAKPTA